MKCFWEKNNGQFLDTSISSVFFVDTNVINVFSYANFNLICLHQFKYRTSTIKLRRQQKEILLH